MAHISTFVEVSQVTSKLTESFIGRIELFRDLSPEECLLLQRKAETRSYEPDSLLFTEHSPRRYLFIIEDGEVELFKTTPQGEETRLSFFRAKDFLGEGALMDDYPHSTSARALLATKVILISREAFFSMFEEHPAMAMKILSRVARVSLPPDAPGQHPGAQCRGPVHLRANPQRARPAGRPGRAGRVLLRDPDPASAWRTSPLAECLWPFTRS